MPLLNSYGRGRRKRGNPREYQIYNIDSMSHLGRPQNWVLSVFPFLLHIISFLLHIPSLPNWTACHLQCRSHLYTLIIPLRSLVIRNEKSKAVTELQVTDYLTEQSNVVTELYLTEYLNSLTWSRRCSWLNIWLNSLTWSRRCSWLIEQRCYYSVMLLGI
jgi:hypothetical protein